MLLLPVLFFSVSMSKTYPSEPDKALYKLCLFTLSVVGIALMPVLLTSSLKKLNIIIR